MYRKRRLKINPYRCVASGLSCHLWCYPSLADSYKQSIGTSSFTRSTVSDLTTSLLYYIRQNHRCLSSSQPFQPFYCCCSLFLSVQCSVLALDCITLLTVITHKPFHPGCKLCSGLGC